MSQRADSNPFIYPVIARLAALVILALLFVPRAMGVVALAAGLSVLFAVAVFFVRNILWKPDGPAAPESTMEPHDETNWPARHVPSLSEALRRIDWFQFEKVVAAIYELEGYSVQRLGGAKPDGGIDLLIEKEGIKTVVRCKHWRHKTITEKELREFLGTLVDAGIPNGIFVTLRGFTKFAEGLAHRHRIVLVGEPALTSMLERANWKQNRRILELLDDKRKFCPRCNRPMVRGTATKGWRAGQQFWACATYPRCDYILDSV